MDLWIEVKVGEREPIYVFGARGQAELSYKERYQPLLRKAFAQRLQVKGAPMAIYHGDHFDGQLADLEAAIPVSGTGDGVREIPGGLFASTTHQGPHGTLANTYTLMGIWIAQNGYRICGAPYDIYRRGGDDAFTPDQFITEIHIPVEKDEPLPEFDFGDGGQ